MEKSLLELIAVTLGVEPGDVTIASSPDTLVEWDSMGHMNLIFAIEEQFNVQFDDEQIVDSMSVQKLLAIIEEKV